MVAGLYDTKMENSRLKANFMSFARIDKRPTKPIVLLSAMLTTLGVARTSRKFGFLLRFLYVNSFQFEDKDNDSSTRPSLEILFVAARKDFRSLEHAINGVIETCRREISKIAIIVPDQDLANCEKVVASCTSSGIQIEIVGESSVLEESLTKLIFSRFGARGGWVLQQVLKLEYVRKSPSAGVLIIDADTVMMKNRTWLNSDGNQVLMPSWEYHKPYFDFLSTLAPFKSHAPFYPKFSFVSHHMLMQPPIVKDIYETCGWDGPKNLVQYLYQLSSKESQSPISIDYELYGHFLFLNYPEKVTLAKWGNTSAKFTEDVSIDILKDRYSHFASVSLHTYLD
jgi:hypothetical protein